MTKLETIKLFVSELDDVELYHNGTDSLFAVKDGRYVQVASHWVDIEITSQIYRLYNHPETCGKVKENQLILLED